MKTIILRAFVLILVLSSQTLAQQQDSWTTFTTANSGLASNNVWIIFESSEGALWFASHHWFLTGDGRGACRYHDGSWTTFNTANSNLASNDIWAIFESSDGALWFGTAGGGVSRFHNGNWKTFTTSDGLTGNHVNCIIEADDGALWFSTSDGGVSRYYNENWQSYTTSNGLANNFNTFILETSDKALWFASYGGGVSRFKDNMWQTFNTGNGLSSNDVWVIFESSDGTVWCGAHHWYLSGYGRGVSHFKDNTWTTFDTNNSGLLSNDVWVIFESSDGALWFGTAGGGVSRYYENKWQTFTSSDGLAGNGVSCMIESGDGALWIGTSDGGASRYKNGIWSTFNADNVLAENYVTDIVESMDHKLWFATYGGGVSRFYNKPYPPQLLSPRNNIFLADSTPELIWEVPEAGAGDSLHFKVEIAFDNNFESATPGSPFESHISQKGFSPIPPLLQGIDSCSYIVQIPLSDNIYYWRISAFDEYNYSDVSEIYKLGIDTTPPESTRTISPPISSNKSFYVSWGGGNDGNGSGLSGKYDVLVKKDDNNWIYWKTKFAGESAIYDGEYNHTYYFEALAWDNAGNREDSTGTLRYKTFVDTTAKDLQPPSQPVELMANNNNPSPWQQSNIFKITWYTPYDPSGIDRCFYKLGAKPQEDYDTTGTYTSIPFPPLTIEATQEYSQYLYVWFKDGNDNIDFKNNASVELRYDATHPEVKINDPKPDTTISGNKLSVNADIIDSNKVEYCLEYKMEFHDQWQKLIQDSSTKSFENQQIYLWEHIQDSGDVYMKLTAWDIAGNSSSDSIKFTLANRDYQLPTAIITYPQNNSYLSGWLEVIGSATDQNFDHYLLSLKSQTIDTSFRKIYTPIEKGQLLVFDTKTVSNGKYTLFLEVVNTKEYRKLTSVTICIDNTPPLIELTSPLSDTISCFVPIQCNIVEDNLKNKIIKYVPSRETDVNNFITLDTTLPYWNTMDLNGYYSLYILAEDKAGLKSDTIRTYYIDNPIFEAQNGLLKKQDEFSLYIPPNGYASSVICFENKNIDEFGYDPAQFIPTDLILEIHSSVPVDTFKKPSVLKINYNNLDLSNYDEEKLSVFTWESENWNFIGGTVNKDDTSVTTTINQIGVYGLFQNEQDTLTINKPLELTCKPRIFFPLGDGYDTKTAISFSLNQETNVTIKVYNAAGRLVKILNENRSLPPGNNVIEWNGIDHSNKFCASGMYIVVIEAGNKTATKTCMVLNEK